MGVVVAGGHFSRLTSDNDTGPSNENKITKVKAGVHVNRSEI